MGTRLEIEESVLERCELFVLEFVRNRIALEVLNRLQQVLPLGRASFDRRDLSENLLDLDLGGQDEFFKQAYAAARRVKWGHTTTYGTLAKQLGGGPETARDVGQAMANNPIPLIIPCHRVLAAGGKIGGFSAPGGAAAKMRMLGLEGVQLEASSGQASFEF